MTSPKLLAILIILTPAAFAQTVPDRASAVVLEAPTTFPIEFTNTVGAKEARPGDPVTARTTQVVRLEDGQTIPKGTKIIGHVTTANPFVFDATPYAQQKSSVLSVHFDSIEVEHQSVPLNIKVRAMADPETSMQARVPINHDIDPTGSTVQIGGDRRYPWNAPVTNVDGDIVAYTRPGGVYAHLIANGHCDGSSVEVSVGPYSASSCGLYGFDRTSAEEYGSLARPSTLILVSTHSSPKIWKYSTALLEVLPGQQSVASR
jgi:hypothetical protein